MIINKLNLRSFGKFNNKIIDFGDRINIVYGENEAGKSTVSTALKTYFYSELSLKKKYKKNCIPIGENSATFDVTSTLDSGEVIESYVTLGKTNAKSIVKTVKKPLDEPFNTADLPLGEYLFNLDEDMFDSVFYIKDLESYSNINTNSSTVSEELSKNNSSTVIDVDVSKVLEDIKNELNAFARKTPTGKIFPYEERLKEINSELLNLNRINEGIEETKQEIIRFKSNLEKKEKELSEIKEKENYLLKYQKYTEAKTQLELREKISKLEKELENCTFEEIEIEKEELEFLEKYSYTDFSKLKPKKSMFILSALLFILGAVGSVFYLPALISFVLPLVTLVVGLKQNKEIKKSASIKNKLDDILSTYKIESYSHYLKKKSEQDKKAYEYEHLKKEISALKENLKDFSSEYAEIYLDKPSFDAYTLKRDYECLCEDISALKIEIAKSEEKEKSAFNNLPDLTSLNEEKQILTDKLNRLYNEAQIAKDAYDILNITAKSFKASYIPYLNEKVKEITNDILSGGIDYLSLRDDLTIEIRMADEANIKGSEFLSHGMGDLINFALRIAIYSLLCDNYNIPLILDDCFIELDDIRFEKIMKYLDNSFKNQVIYFTAHKRIFNLNFENATLIKL